jgi:SAM-dependent methyltransferase
MDTVAERRCRHCSGKFTATLARLGRMPVANDYVDPAAPPLSDPRVELTVMVCGDCRLAQTLDFKDSADLFRADYAYFSSASTAWLDHARRYVDAMIARFELLPGARHVELASNDGYLLQFSRAMELTVLGVEPCSSVAQAAGVLDIETRIEFFSQDCANRLVDQGWQADLVTANNVFAHVPDVNDFARGMRDLLAPQGVATIEVQHLLRLMQRNQFDTIYHEHFSYYSLLAAKRVFEGAGLRLFDVEELDTHGGSLRYFVCRAEAKHVDTLAVQRVLQEELAYGLDTDAVYDRFAERIIRVRQGFRDLLLRLNAEGRSVAAYGAPAKGVTLLNFCGVGPDLIAFTVDKAPSKQGRLIPGVRIPILPPEALTEARPDYIVILPWNLKDEIIEQLAATADWKPEFITAIPEPMIIDRAAPGGRRHVA